MRQKITWFIPGLLVTLLLGLLWAMPAFGAEAGTIQFLNEEDGDAITHVSLNGPAEKPDGFWFQITDGDLDKVVHVKYVPEAADVEDIRGGIALPETAGAPPGSSWYDLQNLDSNSNIDSRDIKVYSSVGADEEIGGGDDEQIAVTATYNSADGTVTTTGDVVAIEFKIKVTEIIGARSGTSQAHPVIQTITTVSASEEVTDDEIEASFTADRLSLLDVTATDTTLLGVLESRHPTIRERVFVGVAREADTTVTPNIEAQTVEENAEEQEIGRAHV